MLSMAKEAHIIMAKWTRERLAKCMRSWLPCFFFLHLMFVQRWPGTMEHSRAGEFNKRFNAATSLCPSAFYVCGAHSMQTNWKRRRKNTTTTTRPKWYRVPKDKMKLFISFHLVICINNLLCELWALHSMLWIAKQIPSQTREREKKNGAYTHVHLPTNFARGSIVVVAPLRFSTASHFPTQNLLCNCLLLLLW